MRINSIAGLFLLLLITGSIAAQNIDLKKKYSSSKDGFKIKYPKDWEKQENLSAYIPVMFLEPAENETDYFRENTNVVVEKTGILSLEQYYEANLKGLQDGLKSYESLDSGSKKINKQDSKWLIYQHNYEGTEVKVLVYFFVFNGKGYVITSSSNPENFDKHRTIFEAITESFKKL